MELFNNYRITIRIIKYSNVKLYYSFNFISLVFINTYQVWSIHFIICNLFFKILKIKHLDHETTTM